MKKLLLFLSLATAGAVQAQTSTLTVLVDSLPYAGFDIIESFNNKLYTFPFSIGGRVNEVNTTTGALTHVATLPALTGSDEYRTYSGNFVFVNGKTVASIFNSGGGNTYHIAAGLSTVDTLLKNHYAFSPIKIVDTMVYINTQPTGLSAPRLYATNLVDPISIIDTNVLGLREANSQKRLYYQIFNAAGTEIILKSTNGSSKNTIETLTGYSGSYGTYWLGEIGSEMFYTTYHRSTTSDTTWIKKCDASGLITVIDTIIRKSSYATNDGTIMNGNKLIIPFLSRVVVYDLTTKTKEDLLVGSFINAYSWPQDNVAKTHFYAVKTSGSTDTTFISDGTAAGTLQYNTTTGKPFKADFENYEISQSLGNKAIICDEYPIANIENELHIGDAANMSLYKLSATSKSYPSHFEKVDGSVFFTIHDASYLKITLMKLEGCDLPITNPLAIKETATSSTIVSTIFPNPSTGHFTIDTKANLQSVAVYNLLGAIVYFNNQKTTLTEIDLSSQASGIYFLKLTDNNGASSIQKIQLVK